MENIYKIKVRTNPDPRWRYPSERRYSASTVLGLGVVHLALASTALLLACLTLTANEALNNELPCHNNETNARFNSQDLIGISNDLNQSDSTQYNNTEEEKNSTSFDLDHNKEQEDGYFKTHTTLTLAPCIMCIGSLAAGLTGLLAWKRWYIDHNIKWFFIMSFMSTITSTICLVLVGTIAVITNEHINYFNTKHSKPSTKYVITLNILIATILEWLWSILSTKVGFVGMGNEYPDDIVISRSRGKVQVNIIHKGNVKGKIAPPDILNHFPVSGKIAKYLPKKGRGNLPKDESHAEYEERVNKFLASNVDANSAA